MEDSNLAKTKSQIPSSNSQSQIAEILRILQKWGVKTLSQLAALNKEELRTRLGPEAVRLWERATGTATRLLKLVQPPEIFIESYEFDHEIETAEPLLFVLRRFLEQLALRLNSIYLVARELTLTITFSKSEPDWRFTKTGEVHTYERTFKIPQPTNDVDLLFRMLQTHLENFKSEHPIVAVALSAEPSRPASQQFGLFETALRNPHQLYETLARLTALVGNDRVGTPVIEETHRPDAFRMEPFCWNGGTASVPSNLSEVGTARCAVRGDGRLNAGEKMPVRLGPAATEVRGHRSAVSLPIALRRFRPGSRTSIFISDGRDCRRDACRHIESDKVRGQIMNQTGPFLLSGNWWDEKTWARAEWDMQLKNGDLIRAHESAGVWEIDGIYD